MGVASIGCHYFTPDCGEAVTAIKRLAGRVEKEERDFGCVRTVCAQLPKAAVDRHGGETGPEYLTLELGAPRLLVIKRRGVVSAFNFEPESPQNWFGIKETLNKSPGTSRRHIFRLFSSQNLEIHTVFLQFWVFNSQNICSPS